MSRPVGSAETIPMVQCGTNPSRHLRGDALPEHAVYKDAGCDLYPSCLACPLVKCRYDVMGGAAALLRVGRNERMVAMAKGASVDDVAAEFRLSRKSVFRILRAARQEGVPR